ncbi:glycosyltransferase [Sphingobacterium sp. LRF_L2]|uniref:glycosyltransferase n=1 Tax=Sphingobacterium sp. LRF_L2 TaxID=3369421 RepID=UPI003F5E133C
MQTILFIGLVWPEPQSSAAGTRILQLVNLFVHRGYEVVFASAAGKTPYSFSLEKQGVQEQAIKLNDSSFDDFIKQLKPDIVVFDRFMIEEQYGWRIRQIAPDALTILDTEDLHFLRAARQDAFKKQQSVDVYNDITKRELAAILRCDLSLIIAEREQNILIEKFKISPSLLYYLPFLEKEITSGIAQEWASFSMRKNFLFIGNFLHEPNWRTVQILKTDIWPLLRKKLPLAELHIYGAYVSEKVSQLHKPKEGFFIKDRAEDARQTMENYRVLLAPIPFGAGVKGKFIDAMHSGTPCVTTSIGADSMTADFNQWNGFVEDNQDAFVEKAMELYERQHIWEKAQEAGVLLLNERYSEDKFSTPFVSHLIQLKGSLREHRQQNFIGQILHTQQLNSTKYMSLWIEAKNRGTFR